MKKRLANFLLLLGALTFAALLLKATDKTCAWLIPDYYGNTFEFIYPPRCEFEFESIDFKYHVKINSMGMREREITPDKKTGVYRILALGDSFTYGWGVESEQTWLRLMEQQLQKAGLPVETLNLGKPGAAPPYYADMAERAIPILHPDLVLIVTLQGDDLASTGPVAHEPVEHWTTRTARRLSTFYPNLVRVVRDKGRPSEAHPEARTWGQPYTLTAERTRVDIENCANNFHKSMSPQQQTRFNALEEKVKDAFLKGMLNPFLIDVATRNPDYYLFTLDLTTPAAKESIDSMAKHFQRIAKVATRNQARVLVLSIPPGVYVNESARKNIERDGFRTTPEMLTSSAPDDAIRLAAEKNKIPFFTVTDGFRQRKDESDLFFELDYHLTAKGHALYADLISPIIQQEIEKK